MKTRKRKQDQTTKIPASKRIAAGHLTDIHTVSEVTSLSRAMIYVMARKGAFPAPVQLTERRVAWRTSDVMAWMKSRQQVTWVA